ncbi:MAG: FtsQ-type POTRA domain-containing protein [Holosporaceae bacterium]|nr:FtsQ-type POTRA domain-containing protein [Holosporaceae bacterium]
MKEKKRDLQNIRIKRPLSIRWHWLLVLMKSNLFLFLLFLASGGGFFFYFDKYKFENPWFLIKKIEFDGNERVQDILLLRASGLRYKSNIFSCPIHEVKKKLECVSWVRSAAVHRKFPDTIYVRISERVPIAIFQSKYKLYLVDADGVVLEHDGIGNFDNLPIVLGDGAGKEAVHLLGCLDKFPILRKQLVFALRVGKRRWDMRINKGITVKLPERNISQALSILHELSNSDGFFSDNIKSIDLRMLDRVVVSNKDSGAD